MTKLSRRNFLGGLTLVAVTVCTPKSMTATSWQRERKLAGKVLLCEPERGLLSFFPDQKSDLHHHLTFDATNLDVRAKLNRIRWQDPIVVRYAWRPDRDTVFGPWEAHEAVCAGNRIPAQRFVLWERQLARSNPNLGPSV